MKNLLLIGIIFSIISCGKISPEGNITTKQLDLQQFSKLNLDGNFRVFYIKSSKNFVVVETYDNINSNLDIEVEDKTLTIKEKRPTEAVDFYNITIYSKYDINDIQISKLAEMNLSSEIKTDHFKLFLKNNAKFIGSIQSRRTDLEMEQLSRANFTGASTNVFLKMKDTTNLISPYWHIKNLKIETKNQPYAEVTVQDSITGSLEDTSKLLYYNDPIQAFKIGKNTKVNNQKLE
ncbi:GIN domain-containing protein [Frigoriflavimonas asaccharolytica]